MDQEGFGYCSNEYEFEAACHEYECEAACPKEISVSNIARMNKEYRRAKVKNPS
jgi:succinate dehydrogenase / fumarate reductase, iron-sulfur subunit